MAAPLPISPARRFAYIDYYKVPAAAYGLLFAVNVVGLLAANYANARMVARLGSDRILRFGAMVVAVSGVALAVDARFGFAGLWGLTIPLFFYFSASGADRRQLGGRRARRLPARGRAPRRRCSARCTTAPASSAPPCSAGFPMGTPWPMGLVIGAAGVLSLVSSLPLGREGR